MLKATRIILSIVLLILSCYGLIIKEFFLLPVIMLLLGSLMVVMALEEFKKKRKAPVGYVLLASSLFIFYVSYQSFLMN